jgi:hypothetical protein
MIMDGIDVNPYAERRQIGMVSQHGDRHVGNILKALGSRCGNLLIV